MISKNSELYQEMIQKVIKRIKTVQREKLSTKKSFDAVQRIMHIIDEEVGLYENKEN